MQGTIAAARAHCANSRGDTHSAAEYAQQALELLPDCSSISQSIRSVATSILGDASWINGNLEEASRAYTEAIRIGREAGNLHMVIIANSNLADILMEQGQLHRAADTIYPILANGSSPGWAKIAIGWQDLCAAWADCLMSATNWTMRSSTFTSASIFAGSGGISTNKPLPMPCWRGWSKPGAIRSKPRKPCGRRSNWPVSIPFLPGGPSR